MESARVIFEPFRIKAVDPIRMTTRSEREAILIEAGNNLFRVHADDVLIDLLTDSGTGAMSSAQWAALMLADESYAGASSYYRFEASVQDVFGFEEVVPTHQGRAAERLLFKSIIHDGGIVPNNTHFDTTRANLEDRGAQALDLPCLESLDTSSDYPFKGNMDVDALQELLAERHEEVPFVMLTLTNNAEGGQPVSLENARKVAALCKQYGKPLYIDACRFAENAWLVKEREHLHDMSVKEICRSFFDLADGATMSAKKDGLANIGGFLACRDAALAQKCRGMLVVTEGFPTYGGLAGRDLEAVAQGLGEVIQEDYLRYRTASIRYMVDKLKSSGIPVLTPAGGHAVFLDAARFLSHLDLSVFPGHALALELYLEGGIRSCEIGSVMLGKTDPETGKEIKFARHELVRLALPRRTYTQSHMDYVLEVIVSVWNRRDEVKGVRIVESPPVLRHFLARFEWCES